MVVSLAEAALGSGASFITAPVRSVRVWIAESSGAVPSYLRSRAALVEENRALENALREHQHDGRTIAELSRENDELRALLGVPRESRIAAGVLSRPSETPYDTLLIDRGRIDGVTTGALVYGEANRVLGVVSKAFQRSALVTLATSPGVRSTVYIYGPDIFTHAEGMGGGVLRVSVPQEIAIEEGDVVVLPSVRSGAYGVISHVEAAESSPVQYGFVTAPAAISSLRLVAVTRTPVPSLSFEEALQAVAEARESIFHIDVPVEDLVDAAATSTGSLPGSPETESLIDGEDL